MTDQLSGYALIRAAYDVPALDQHERAVLVLLAFMANADGKAWPSIDHMAEKIGASRRTVQAARRRLEASGLIAWEERPGRGCIYTVTLATRAADAPLPVQEVHPCSERTGAGDAQTGAPRAPKLPRTTNTSQKATPSSRTRARRTGDVQLLAAPPDLPEWVPREPWAAYAEMRAGMAKDPKKPRPWTQSVASKAVEQLERLARDGHDPGRVLDQSVLNGWQGLFGIKSDEPGRGGRTVRAMQRVNQMLSEYGQ